MFSISEEHVGEGLLRGGALPKVHEDPLVLVIVEVTNLARLSCFSSFMVSVGNWYRHLLEHQDQLMCVTLAPD
jgi:hypothetical protein